MLINLIVGSKVVNGDGEFKDNSWELKLSRTRRFLAYAMQLNCLPIVPEFAWQRRREPSWTYPGTKLETAAQGKTLTSRLPLLRRDNLGGGNAPDFPGKRSSTIVMRGNLKTPASSR